MRLLLSLSLIIVLSACSQQSVNRASYSTGRAARTVVEGAKQAYHATVEGASQAYENASEGYRSHSDTENTIASNQDEDSEEEYLEQQAPKAKFQGDTYY